MVNLGPTIPSKKNGVWAEKEEERERDKGGKSNTSFLERTLRQTWFSLSQVRILLSMFDIWNRWTQVDPLILYPTLILLLWLISFGTTFPIKRLLCGNSSHLSGTPTRDSCPEGACYGVHYPSLVERICTKLRLSYSQGCDNFSSAYLENPARSEVRASSGSENTGFLEACTTK